MSPRAAAQTRARHPVAFFFFFLFFLFLSRLNVPVENNTKDRGEKTLSSAARRVHCLHEIRQDDSHEMQRRVGC